MDVAVLGGGLQGCCVAMALADAGARVVLYDRNAELMTRAAVANEGKMHLGYMYAGDPTLSTARTMIRGALAFAPWLGARLGLGVDRLPVSQPAVYVIHRDSQHPMEEVAGHLHAVHRLAQEAAAGRKDAYFGRDLSAPLRAWSRSERDDWYDPSTALAAFDTPELAVQPEALAGLVRARVRATPGVELRLGETVAGVSEEGEQLAVESLGTGGRARERFDHVVNALWDGRLGIDATMGMVPARPWIHRLRYGIILRPAASSRRPPTTTIIHGAFGEVVNHGQGALNLLWYPACLAGTSHELVPPDWPMEPPEPLCAQIAQASYDGLCGVVPALKQIDPGTAEVTVKGGVIVAWGATDIDDRNSELHRRSDIGISTRGRYHSIDPGKLTMIPCFASECAARIIGG